MPTWTAQTALQGQDAAQALCVALENMTPEPTGVGVYELDEDRDSWEVTGYFDQLPDAAGLSLLAVMHKAESFTIEELPDVDWVAHVRRELTPVEAGRFFVYGSHDEDKLPDDKIGLLIDAAMAFGTGHHGTTLGCLEALDRLATEGFVGKNVADIGCGTAVLAMAAARIWPDRVLASDIDEVAVQVAQENVTANDLDGRVECVVAAGFNAPALQGTAPFDLVFANILKGPLIGLAPDMGANIQPQGYAILSGILNAQADDVIKAYLENGFSLTDRREIGDWTTLVLQKSN